MNIINSLRQSLSIGPVNLPLIFIPIFLAWIIYQFLIKLFYRNRYKQLQKADRLMFNGLFIILVVWKLSPVLFQFSSVIKNPVAVLYLPGGISGVVLGLASALVFYTVSILRQKEERLSLVKSLGFNIGVLLSLFVGFSIGTAVISNKIYEQSEPSVLEVGTEAPGFILDGEDGLSYRLSDYIGKTVILNFWASWCPPCRAELPELKTFYEELNPEDAVFLSINLFTSERNSEGLPEFIKNEGLSFPVLFDKTGEVAADYRVESIPTTIIINRDGMVANIKSGAVTAAWLKRVSR